MSTLLAHPAFQGPPDSGQFARNGEWEGAWAFPRGRTPDGAAVEAYLGSATEVAFEAFFGQAFFGLRFLGDPASVATAAIGCVQALRRSGPGAPFFATLGGLVRLGPLGTGIARAEIGAVNAWRSQAPFGLPSPPEALGDFPGLWARLSRSPLAGETAHAKAIEFAFADPLPHWFGLPVSRPGQPGSLSQRRLRKALESAARATG